MPCVCKHSFDCGRFFGHNSGTNVPLYIGLIWCFASHGAGLVFPHLKMSGSFLEFLQIVHPKGLFVVLLHAAMEVALLPSPVSAVQIVHPKVSLFVHLHAAMEVELLPSLVSAVLHCFF